MEKKLKLKLESLFTEEELREICEKKIKKNNRVMYYSSPDRWIYYKIGTSPNNNFHIYFYHKFGEVSPRALLQETVRIIIKIDKERSEKLVSIPFWNKYYYNRSKKVTDMIRKIVKSNNQNCDFEKKFVGKYLLEKLEKENDSRRISENY